MNRTIKYPIGSVSSGTMREEDLIPAFLDTLEALDPENTNMLREDYRELLGKLYEFGAEDLTEDEMEELSALLNETLFDRLNAFALPYFYFGSHPGDDCDYGFWLPEDLNQQVEDNGGLVVSDTSDVPKDFEGDVLHVNDHGNATLYTAASGELTEVWAVV